MNERIRELADQADIVFGHYNNNAVLCSAIDINKFAKLIVQECLDACSRANEIRHFVPPTQEQVVLSCMREIEQHFGVEE